MLDITFHQAKLTKKTRYLICLLGLVGLIGGWAFSNCFSLRYNTPITPWYDYMSLPVALTSIAVFYWLRNLGKRLTGVSILKADKLLIFLSKLTFGIYLVHFVFVRILVVRFHLFDYIPNTFISVPLDTIVVFLFSTIVMYFVSYILWFNHHIRWYSKHTKKTHRMMSLFVYVYLNYKFHLIQIGLV